MEILLINVFKRSYVCNLKCQNYKTESHKYEIVLAAELNKRKKYFGKSVNSSTNCNSKWFKLVGTIDVSKHSLDHSCGPHSAA